MKVQFFNLEKFDESEYTRVVVTCKYHGRWVFVRQKGKSTWEIPGGHIEKGESYMTALRRELYEETGATALKNIQPVCAYTISKPAILCYAEIEKLENLPDFEIAEVGFFDALPKDLTYPETHTLIFERVCKFLKS